MTPSRSLVASSVARERRKFRGDADDGLVLMALLRNAVVGSTSSPASFDEPGSESLFSRRTASWTTYHQIALVVTGSPVTRAHILPFKESVLKASSKAARSREEPTYATRASFKDSRASPLRPSFMYCMPFSTRL